MDHRAMPRPSNTMGIGDSLGAKKGPTAAAAGLRWTLRDRQCVAVAAFHAVEAREARASGTLCVSARLATRRPRRKQSWADSKEA